MGSHFQASTSVHMPIFECFLVVLLVIVVVSIKYLLGTHIWIFKNSCFFFVFLYRNLRKKVLTYLSDCNLVRNGRARKKHNMVYAIKDSLRKTKSYFVPKRICERNLILCPHRAVSVLLEKIKLPN